MKISSKLFLICALVLCASLGLAGAASACYGVCVETGPLCWTCESASYRTGDVCWNSKPCKCEALPSYSCIQIEQSPGDEPVTLADLGIAEGPGPAQCAAPAEAETGE